jgi:hypothetical protein
MSARAVAWLGIVVFAVSWFLDVHQGLSAASELERALDEPLDELRRAGGGSSDDAPESSWRPRGRRDTGRPAVVAGGPPGWRAFRFAWDLLFTKGGDDGVRRILLGLTSVTNVLMLGALVVLLTGAARTRGLGFLLLAAAALNAGWIYLVDDVREGLQVGYYLWLASFAVVGFALLRPSDEVRAT